MNVSDFNIQHAIAIEKYCLFHNKAIELDNGSIVLDRGSNLLFWCIIQADNAPPKHPTIDYLKIADNIRCFVAYFGTTG
jgi:hypothetical protein